ncbi:hypothetical protein [Chitinimonas lacunae]|uniref:HEAT repeat domain-containing protein n=1 Tax=Chitinimonas lacunae TaxID=1963018 RepID=A0ABV8MJK9_9NEIS
MNANDTAAMTVELYRPGPAPQQAQVALEASAGAYWVVLRQHDGNQWRTLRKHSTALAWEAACERHRQAVAALLDDGFLGVVSMVPPVDTPPFELPAGQRATLLARLEAENWRLLSPLRRSRTAWRLGELRLAAAVPRLVELLGTGEALLDYSIAWACGRCGDPGAKVALDELSRRSADEMVRRMARLAWLELAETSEREVLAARLIADWPAVLREAWRAGEPARLYPVIDAPSTWKNFSYADWLEQLDQVARIDPAIRPLLQREIARMPLEAGYFRTLRRLYKAAELRGDAEIWSLLQRRFEQTSGRFRSDQGLYLDGRWVRPEKELSRPDSRLAYSVDTRNYLIRRGWRLLRRLGEAGSPEFALLAFAVLLRYDDRDGEPPFLRTFYVQEGRRWTAVQRHYHRHSEAVLFNRLLYRPGGPVHLSRHGLRSWALDKLTAEREQRVESLPEQWNRRPDLLLRLALESHSEWVQGFAVRALADQPLYCARLDDQLWRRLLNSPFAVTANFAHRQLSERIAAGAERREDWLALLLGSRHEAIARAGLELLAADPASHAASSRLVTAALTARLAEVRRQARLLAQAATAVAGVAEAVLAALLDWLEAADPFTESLDEIAPELTWALTQPFRTAASQVERQRLLALLDHPCVAVRCLAVEWLLLYPQAPQDLPTTRYHALLDSEDERLVAAGIRLLGALPEPVLFTQAELIARFCLSPHRLARQAALQVAGRLAGHDAGFCATLLPRLLDGLFRTESSPDLHDDLYSALTGSLAEPLRTQPLDLTLRLLESRSRGAQRLGAWLLAGRADGDLSAAQWARLARHETLAIRQRAVTILTEHFAEIGLVDLLPVLDSRWDDSRAAVLTLLRERVEAAVWTPEQLIALCDHAYGDVQQLGCELLAARLAAGQNSQCLLALAQHPSLRIQGFVADWLQRSVGDQAAELARLRPYFLTVLSQVNRGRAAKTALFEFLGARAAASEAAAREVAALFERLAVTVALTDRAQYVAGLYAIRRRYPELATALTIHTPTVRQGEA